MAGVVVSLAVCLLGLLVVYRCLAAWGLRAPVSYTHLTLPTTSRV